MKKFKQIGRCKTVKEQGFESNAVFNRELVELLENWSDIVKRRNPGGDTRVEFFTC